MHCASLDLVTFSYCSCHHAVHAELCWCAMVLKFVGLSQEPLAFPQHTAVLQHVPSSFHPGKTAWHNVCQWVCVAGLDACLQLPCKMEISLARTLLALIALLGLCSSGSSQWQTIHAPTTTACQQAICKQAAPAYKCGAHRAALSVRPVSGELKPSCCARAAAEHGMQSMSQPALQNSFSLFDPATAGVASRCMSLKAFTHQVCHPNIEQSDSDTAHMKIGACSVLGSEACLRDHTHDLQLPCCMPVPSLCNC